MLKSVTKQFLIYAAGSIVQRALSFVTYPFLIQYLAPAQMGLVALSNSFIAIVSVLIGCGLRQLYVAECIHISENEQRALLADIVGLYMLVAIIITTILLTWYGIFNKIFFAGASDFALYLMMVIQCGILFFVELFYQILTFQGRSLLLNVVQLIVGAATPLLLILCIAKQPHALMYMMVIVGITACVAFYALVFLWRTKIFQDISTGRITNLWLSYLKRGAMFVPTVLAGWLFSSIARWCLAGYSSLDQVGVYAIAEMSGVVIQILLLQSLAASYLPQTLLRFAQGNPKAVERINMQFMGAMMAFLTLILSLGYWLGSSSLYALLPVAYRPALPYGLIIGYAHVFLAGSYCTTIYMQYCKRMDLLVWIIGITTAVLGIISFLLIPYHAIAGASWTLLIAYAFYFTLTLGCNYLLHTGKLKSHAQ